jgi:GDPmannose 4,6-dehydratase
MSISGEAPQDSTPRHALICGISGQDGAYLARLLLDKGYRVTGTSRDASTMSLRGLRFLGVEGRVELVSMAPNDFRSVLQTVRRAAPDEIYFLAGQTSVGLSFEQPVEAIESISIGILNLLEAIRFIGRPVRLYNAGSSEVFGDTGGQPATASSAHRPRSPYAVAKSTAQMLVANYREAYELFACTGILFNHESPLRPERFVTQKIVQAARRIAAGSGERLKLGNLNVDRDWGWGPEYVEAMWMMLQRDVPEDFVVATGRTVSLEYFVQNVFARLGLDWREHTSSERALLRPSDIRHSAADIGETTGRLGWTARHDVDDVIRMMCEGSNAVAIEQ